MANEEQDSIERILEDVISGYKERIKEVKASIEKNESPEVKKSLEGVLADLEAELESFESQLASLKPIEPPQPF